MNLPRRTPIHEVFASTQGEGLFVGEPQVFLRLAGCPLRCAWCDTPQSWCLPAREREGADWQAGLTRSWCETREVAAYIDELDPGGRKTLSVTGGEPLMWPEFLAELKREMPGRRMHLETAGAFPRSLEASLGLFEHISADLKLAPDLGPPVPLPSSAGVFEAAPRNEREWLLARRAVLSLLAPRPACLKLIVAGENAPEAFDGCLDEVQRLAPDLPLFLQPASATRGTRAPAAECLERIAQAGLERGLRVRVLPQLHVLLGIR